METKGEETIQLYTDSNKKVEITLPSEQEVNFQSIWEQEEIRQQRLAPFVLSEDISGFDPKNVDHLIAGFDLQFAKDNSQGVASLVIWSRRTCKVLYSAV